MERSYRHHYAKECGTGVKSSFTATGSAYDVAQHEVSNHFCWHVTAAYRYGQLRQDRSIMISPMR